MKMETLLQCESSLPKLINTDLPVIYSYRLSSILDDVQRYVGKLQEFRTMFINKHGEAVGDEGQFQIPREKAKEFDEGIDMIAEEEITLPAIDIPLSILLESDIKLTALEIKVLKKAGFILDDISTSEE